MRNDPRAPQLLGRRQNASDILHQCKAALHPTVHLTDTIHRFLAPQQIPDSNGSDHGFPSGQVQLQPQQSYDQRMNIWTATPPGMLRASPSFSAPYRFTPDINDMDEERCRRPPNRDPVRTGDDLVPGSTRAQPREPINWKMYDEPSSRPSDQRPSRTGDRDLH